MIMSSELSSNFLQFEIGMVNGNGHSVYEFDHFRLDAAKLMLYRADEAIPLPPKVIKTLAVLVENSGQILSKDELMERVWSDSVVEESNLSQYLYLLRKTLGRMPAGGPYIETLRRRGYRFNGEMRELPAEKLNGASVRAEIPQVQTIREGNVLRVAEWQPATFTEPATDIVTQPTALPPARSSVVPKLMLAGVLVAIAIGASWYFWPRAFLGSATNENVPEVSITQLTNGSFVYGATISRDGKYFVYNEIDPKTSRLFLQQTGQNSRLEILSSTDFTFDNVSFSPDGGSIYYSATTRVDPKTFLYRIPTIGRSPTKLLDNVTAVSFSPDGSSIAFRRANGIENSTIVIADKDGRNEKVILRRSGAKSVGYVAWSPKAGTIVFSELDRTGNWKWYLREVDVATGAERELMQEPWANIFRIEWVPDGSGIVLIGTRQGDALSIHRDQVYFVSYPDCISKRVTNDGSRHSPTALGVTNDGAIIAVPASRPSQIWSMDANGDATTAQQITRGTADGRGGLVPMPDGSVAYTSRTAEDVTIWIASANGSSPRQVATGLKYLEELRGDRAGKFFIFSTAADLGAPSPQHLYRIDVDGGNFKQLTSGESQEIDSSISPDGNTIIADFEDMAADGEQTITLQKFQAAGGEAQKITDQTCRTPIFSPDGSMISCVRNEAEVFVIKTSDGSVMRNFQIPPVNGSNIGAVWTPDSSGLVVITHENGVSNLVMFPIDKSKPFKLTNFSSGAIYRFAFSQDGKRLLLARGYPTQEAILIKNFR
jgi:DNA-binding winged helix-turn-helix (wHTH) protein/Tol biopolymer transport system component